MSLPPVANNPKDMLKYYKDGMQFFYKELVIDNQYLPEEDRKMSIDKFAENMYPQWFYGVAKIQTPEARQLIEENKDKIYNKVKRMFSDFKPKGQALDLLFWYAAYDWYKAYGEKLESQKRKEAEAERKRKAQEEREAEVAKAKLARIEKIVDLDADSEEDLLPSYVGKVIIQCPQCMTLFYKNQEDIEAAGGG